MKRFINLALRASALLGKFLLIFVLARFLPPSEVGLYGLVVASVGYSLFLLGFDFYTYATRQMLQVESSTWGRVLKNQSALYCVSYVFFLPLLVLLFVRGLLPWNLIGWFFLLLILEHMTQECGRILVALSEQLLASIVLFLRSGLWALVVAVLMYTDVEFRQLETVFFAWALGGVTALCLAVSKLMRLNIGGWRESIDWRWIAKGVRVAIPFLIATLCIRALYTLDRYWLEALAGLDVLGAYVLFAGLCGALIAFLDAGVFAFSYPTLIAQFNSRDKDGFRRGMKTMALYTGLLSSGFAVVALLSLAPLLNWLGNTVYLDYQNVFYWLLLSTLLYAMSMIPHFGLYAQGHDKPIIYSQVVGLAIFVLIASVVSVGFGFLAVPFALCGAFLSILIWKSVAFAVLTPREYRSKLFY